MSDAQPTERRHDLMDIRRAVGWTVLAVAGLLAVVLTVAFAALGTPGVERAGRLTVAELFDLLKLAFAVAAGLGAVVALVMAYRRQRVAEADNLLAEAVQAHRQATDERAWRQRETAAEDARHDATERRLTELYAVAATQLGSDRAPVRLAGLYALVRLAEGSPPHRQTVVNLLCAYLRMPWTPDDDGPDRREERVVRLTAQRILAAHLDPGADGSHWAGMDLDLTGAVLEQWRLGPARVNACALAGARFHGATDLVGARFDGPVDLAGATFHGAADLREVSMAGVSFEDTRFEGPLHADGATFTGRCSLAGAHFLDDAYFAGATFEVLTAETATFEAAALFSRATFGRASFRQAGFDGDAAWAGAEFADLVTFGRARFTSVSFRDTAFRGNVEFRATLFQGEAGFVGAVFEEAVTFDAARLTPAFSLEGAHAEGSDRYERIWPDGWRPGPDGRLAGTTVQSSDNK